MHRLALPLPAALLGGLLLVMTACAAGSATSMGALSNTPLQVVDEVDLERFMGAWYEVARYPNRFQRDHVAVIARYELVKDGREIKLRNTARKGSFDGKVERGSAKGWPVKGADGAKWKVQFIWPFKADYWIIDLDDEEYQWAVVGQPKRENLWILSRTRALDEDVMQGIRERLRENGYDPDRLQATPHPPAP